MTPVLKIANAESRPRRDGDFIETETARDMMRSLELMRANEGSSITMIAGAPGTGKSSVLKEFSNDQGYDCIFVSVARCEGKPTALAESILNRFNKKVCGLSLFERGDLVCNYIGNGRVLVLDEAQHLTPDGAEWIRAIAEDGRFDLVLCGDLALANLVHGIPQLNSRLLRPVVASSVTQSDVEAFVTGTAFDTPPAIQALCAVAQLGGGLRNVVNVLRLANLFAGPDHPTLHHLKAAIVDMKLSPRGANS